MSKDLADAIDTYARLKQTNLKVLDYLKQSHMFGDELTPFQSQILEHLDTIGQKPKMIREFLRESAVPRYASFRPGRPCQKTCAVPS